MKCRCRLAVWRQLPKLFLARAVQCDCKAHKFAEGSHLWETAISRQDERRKRKPYMQVSPIGMATASQAVLARAVQCDCKAHKFAEGSHLWETAISRQDERRKRKLYMQVSPSGMATASQAVPGEFDSRHLLHRKSPVWGFFA